jgi:hypothetical protein
MGCELSGDHALLEILTDGGLDQVEREIKELPEDSVILKRLNDCLLG